MRLLILQCVCVLSWWGVAVAPTFVSLKNAIKGVACAETYDTIMRLICGTRLLQILLCSLEIVFLFVFAGDLY